MSAIYVDEAKTGGYLLVAAVVLPDDSAAVRAVLRGLVLKGQYRIHMKKERDSRKRAIVDAICASGARATIYDAGRGRRYELDARAACLRALVADVAGDDRGLLVLEQDDSLLGWDKQQLIELSREFGCRDTLRYRHERAAAEQLLALPDAIAWCWAKGGEWRKRIEPVVDTVRPV